MAKATRECKIVEPEKVIPAKTENTIILELTENEAKAIMALAGITTFTGYDVEKKSHINSTGTTPVAQVYKTLRSLFYADNPYKSVRTVFTSTSHVQFLSNDVEL